MRRKKNKTIDPADFCDAPVYVTEGVHEGRIGYCDGDEGDSKTAVVFFGLPHETTWSFHSIPFASLEHVSMGRILQRHEEITKSLFEIYSSGAADDYKNELIEELYYIAFVLRKMEDELPNHWPDEEGSRVFISHSSVDKPYARCLSLDLRRLGYQVWLDEWNIGVGESIPSAISEGIRASDYVMLVLTKQAVESRWVENEWQTKYWEEIQQRRIRILPLLFEECEIPYLLKHRKYADFRSSYSYGLEQVRDALSKFDAKATLPNERAKIYLLKLDVVEENDSKVEMGGFNYICKCCSTREALVKCKKAIEMQRMSGCMFEGHVSIFVKDIIEVQDLAEDGLVCMYSIGASENSLHLYNSLPGNSSPNYLRYVYTDDTGQSGAPIVEYDDA